MVELVRLECSVTRTPMTLPTSTSPPPPTGLRRIHCYSTCQRAALGFRYQPNNSAKWKRSRILRLVTTLGSRAWLSWTLLQLILLVTVVVFTINEIGRRAGALLPHGAFCLVVAISQIKTARTAFRQSREVIHL